jgi:hypothetical protein
MSKRKYDDDGEGKEEKKKVKPLIEDDLEERFPFLIPDELKNDKSLREVFCTWAYACVLHNNECLPDGVQRTPSFYCVAHACDKHEIFLEHHFLECVERILFSNEGRFTYDEEGKLDYRSNIHGDDNSVYNTFVRMTSVPHECTKEMSSDLSKPKKPSYVYFMKVVIHSAIHHRLKFEDLKREWKLRSEKLQLHTRNLIDGSVDLALQRFAGSPFPNETWNSRMIRGVRRILFDFDITEEKCTEVISKVKEVFPNMLVTNQMRTHSHLI